jgi:perosamine synthetase
MFRKQPVNTSALAIHGGQPLLPEGPPTWPPIDESVAAALKDMAADGSWGRYHGPHLERLTDALADCHAGHHVVPCCSGTIAVELALRGLQVGDGDEVILAGYDFPGNFRSIEAVGARPVLVDIDPASWSLDCELIEQAVSPATRAVIVSHLHGGLANMSRLLEIARDLKLRVIEDACQTPGAWLDGAAAGCHGDLGIFSFGGSKLLSAGRGGAIISPHEDLVQRIKVFSERGNDAFALSEMQACVLLPQLQQLDQRNKQRAEAVTRLLQALDGLAALQPIATPVAGRQDRRGSYYKLAWLLQAGSAREDLLAGMQAEGAALHAGFRGFARRRGPRCRQAGQLVHSQRAADSTVILHHPVLLAGDQTVDRLAAAFHRVLAGLPMEQS